MKDYDEAIRRCLLGIGGDANALNLPTREWGRRTWAHGLSERAKAVAMERACERFGIRPVANNEIGYATACAVWAGARIDPRLFEILYADPNDKVEWAVMSAAIDAKFGADQQEKFFESVLDLARDSAVVVLYPGNARRRFRATLLDSIGLREIGSAGVLR